MTVRTLKLTIAYDGTDFSGWQVQAAGRDRPAQRTIQGTIEAALFQILRERVHVRGSGRTDAGVHALAQVAHTCIRSEIPLENLQRGLNALLRPSIVITDLVEAPPGFHAQYRAIRKRYRYRIVNAPFVSPFEHRYAQCIMVPLKAAVMKREVRVLRGRHDFAPFQKVGSVVVKDATRTISDVRLTKRAGGYLDFEIEANGFLYGMVRRIVGTLIQVGQGYKPPGTIARILRTKNSSLVGPTAPARGLCLVRVTYQAPRKSWRKNVMGGSSTKESGETGKTRPSTIRPMSSKLP